MTFEPLVTQKMRILRRKTALQYRRWGGAAGSVILSRSRCYTILYGGCIGQRPNCRNVHDAVLCVIYLQTLCS